MCVRCAMFMHKGTLFLRPARSLMGTCRQKEVSIPTKTYMQSEIFPPKNIYRLMDGYRQTAVWSLENIYRLLLWRWKFIFAAQRFKLFGHKPMEFGSPFKRTKPGNPQMLGVHRLATG